ncbi:hypothetical protein K3495_g15408, partial [Podosphaera aphanis]
MGDAIKAIGRRSSPRPGSGAPWWIPECREARIYFQTHRDPESRKVLRKAIAKAKRQYWRRKFAEAESDADLYKLARGAKGGQQIKNTPLRTANGLETDPERRAYLLRDLLLGRFTNENDINDEGPPEGHPPLGHLPWDTEVTEEEA